jgi:hypothetical protein
LTFYNERSSIPRKGARPVVGETEENLTIGPEEIEETLGGIMRQLETTIFLDLTGARELQEWLERHIKTLEELSAAVAKAQK